MDEEEERKGKETLEHISTHRSDKVPMLSLDCADKEQDISMGPTPISHHGEDCYFKYLIVETELDLNRIYVWSILAIFQLL